MNLEQFTFLYKPLEPKIGQTSSQISLMNKREKRKEEKCNNCDDPTKLVYQCKNLPFNKKECLSLQTHLICLKRITYTEMEGKIPFNFRLTWRDSGYSNALFCPNCDYEVYCICGK